MSTTHAPDPHAPDQRVATLVTIQTLLEEVSPLVHEWMKDKDGLCFPGMTYRIYRREVDGIWELYFTKPGMRLEHPVPSERLKLLEAASLLDIPERCRLLADLWELRR